MGRSSKFAFPLPGRRAQAERDARLERVPTPDYDFPQPSKAERLLGTGLPGRRTGSAASASSFPRNNSVTPSLETKKSYMSITLSEASQEAASRRKGSPATDESLLVPPHPRFHQDFSRSKDRSGSVTSSMYSKQLNSQGSSSTLRSHYDAQRQPLYVSQQTSMSAVRDGGLRKGHPSVYSSSSRSIDQESIPGSVWSAGVDSTSVSSGSGAGKKKKIPARLDLSKLFPKTPKAKENNDQHLLSPTKFVSSPVPMSSTSTHFPRPLTSPTTSYSNRNRAPSVTSTKTSDTLREGRAQAAKDRAYNTPFDNAKVNRRRPPPGIQHWFEGLSDDDEEEEEEEEKMPAARVNTKVQESRALPPRQAPAHDHRRQPSPPRHGRKNSHVKAAPAERTYPPAERVYPAERTHPAERIYPAERTYPTERAYAAERKHRAERAYPNEAKAVPQNHPYRADTSQGGHASRPSDKPHLRGQPSQASLASHDTRTSAWTKTSKMSNRDLKGDSVLSLSSSEDESDPRSSGASLPLIRDSIAMSTDTEGEILIGRAQAFDIRPRQDRTSRRMTAASGMTSASGMTNTSRASIQSSATGATIDVMLSPTTAASSQTNLVLPRHSNSRSGRRSQHSRQVSAIPEDDHDDSKRYPKSVHDDRDNSSIKSGRTSKSEPSKMGHKLMAVTEEEEVLLELMRRKRAAMAKQSFTDGYRSAMKIEQTRSDTPTFSADDQHNASSSVYTESPGSEYSRRPALSESDRRASKKSILSQTTAAGTETSSSTAETLCNATYVPPPPRSEKRNRVPPTANEALLRSPGSSSLASTSSVFSSPRARMAQRITSQPPQLSPAIFSPLEVFASPPDSPTFPATASHTDTIPSPVTPGPVSDGELPIKVVGSSIGGSEASFGADHDSIHNHHHHHHHHPSDISMSHKGKERARRMGDYNKEREIDDARSVDRSRSHSRRRTASSGANVDPCVETPGQAVTSDVIVPPRTSSQLAFPKPGGAVRHEAMASISSVATSKGRTRPGPPEWDWDGEVDVSAVISHVRKSRSSQMLGSSRTSMSSNTPAHVPKTRLSRQSSVTSHVSSRSGTRSDVGDKLVPAAAIAARSSVCDDVLSAWSSLGGSRGEYYG